MLSFIRSRLFYYHHVIYYDMTSKFDPDNSCEAIAHGQIFNIPLTIRTHVYAQILYDKLLHN